MQSKAVSVTVATDDVRIQEAMMLHGAEVVMTDPDHPSGTDRLAEVARLKDWDSSAIVVNLQGDEPLMPVANLEQVADLLAGIRKPQLQRFASQSKQLTPSTMLRLSKW